MARGSRVSVEGERRNPPRAVSREQEGSPESKTKPQPHEPLGCFPGMPGPNVLLTKELAESSSPLPLPASVLQRREC